MASAHLPVLHPRVHVSRCVRLGDGTPQEFIPSCAIIDVLVCIGFSLSSSPVLPFRWIVFVASDGMILIRTWLCMRTA